MRHLSGDEYQRWLKATGGPAQHAARAAAIRRADAAFSATDEYYLRLQARGVSVPAPRAAVNELARRSRSRSAPPQRQATRGPALRQRARTLLNRDSPFLAELRRQSSIETESMLRRARARLSEHRARAHWAELPGEWPD